jgi:hypothetical protein
MNFHTTEEDWKYVGLILWHPDILPHTITLSELELIVTDTLSLPNYFAQIKRLLSPCQ